MVETLVLLVGFGAALFTLLLPAWILIQWLAQNGADSDGR